MDVTEEEEGDALIAAAGAAAAIEFVDNKYEVVVGVDADAVIVDDGEEQVAAIATGDDRDRSFSLKFKNFKFGVH